MGGWLPPQMMWRSCGGRPRATSSSATPSHTVGTPADTVSPSSWSMSTRPPGSRAPGVNTCLAPTAVADRLTSDLAPRPPAAPGGGGREGGEGHAAHRARAAEPRRRRARARGVEEGARPPAGERAGDLARRAEPPELHDVEHGP